MKQKFKSIRSRIILFSVGFALVLAVFVSTVSYMVFQDFLQKNQLQAAQNNLQLLGNQLDSSLTDIVLFANWCGLDSEISNYLKHADSETALSGMYEADEAHQSSETEWADEAQRRFAGKQAQRKLALDAWEQLSQEFNKVTARRYMGRSIIATMNGRHFIQVQPSPSTSKGIASENVYNAPFFEELLAAKGVKWVGLAENPVTKYLNPQVIPLLRPIYNEYSSAQLGWIYVEISPNIVTESFKRFHMAADSALFVSFADGGTYRFSEGTLVADSLPKDNIVSFTLPNQGWVVSQLLSRQELKQQQSMYIAIICGIFLVILVMGVCLVWFLNRSVTVPINAIIRRIDCIGGGDFSRDPSVEWDNELGRIGKGINDLSENVHALMEKKVQDEKMRQELEYKILQAQINPHFLYNTLNSIKWMATIQGAEGIADMTTALSRLMKSVAKGSERLIPLRDEKALLDDYFTIMRYRYGGSVELSYEIDDEALLDCLVHRFSLQPIVENAIFHGIEPKGGAGSILIHVYEAWQEEKTPEKGTGQSDAAAPEDAAHTHAKESKDESTALRHCLMIAIRDNGVGMDAETAARVLEGQSGDRHDFFKHVGVANVNQRIHFTFGDAYGISIESEVGAYTEMRFTLPYLLEDDVSAGGLKGFNIKERIKDVQTADCG